MIRTVETRQLDYSVVLIGPGQSGQEIGMGQKIAERSHAAYGVWDLTNLVHRPGLGYDLTDLVWNRKINGMEVSDEEARAELTKTPITQAAVFADSIARWIVGKEAGEIPEAGVHSGFSLGRLVACVTSGAMDIEDATPLVKARGDAFYMVKGWLVALVGVEPEITEIILRDRKQEIGNSTIYLSMINTPQQIVVGGEESTRDDVKSWLTEYDLEDRSDYTWVQVSGPFHTPLMKEARAPYAEALRQARIIAPTRGILLGNNGRSLEDPDDTREDLLSQTTQAENFDSIGRTLYRMGVNTMICLSAKPTEANMLGQIAKAKDISRQGVHTSIEHTYSGDENPTLMAYKWKVAG